jgi:hypothetical protein
MPVVTIVVSVKKKKRLAQDPQPPDRISTARKHCKRLIKRPLHWTETRSRHRLWKHGHTIGPQMLKLVPIAEEDEGCSSPEAELPSPLTPSSPSGGCFALLMSRLRPSPTPTLSPSTRSLRVVAAGTLFLTHTLSLPTHPGPTQTVRAHEYARSRGGSAPAILAVLSQLQVDKCWLVASLGGAQEARAVARELEAEGVSTRYCKVWEGAGVPAAWVLHAGKCPLFSILLDTYVAETAEFLFESGLARSHAMHCCFVTIFFMCEVRGKLISVLQATRIASQLSTTIRFQTFLTRSLSPFWGPCLSLSTIPLQSHPWRLHPFPHPHHRR